MALEDGRERFRRAVGILVDEKDRIRKRLLVAYASQLSLIDPSNDLPEDLVADFIRLKLGLSDAEMPYGYGDRASEKTTNMSEDEASQCAKGIFDLFLKLSAGEMREPHALLQ